MKQGLDDHPTTLRNIINEEVNRKGKKEEEERRTTKA